VSRFGAKLKNARESRGLSLHGVSDMTKISIPLLEALERDDYSRLPGGIFNRSFVRAYATAVGLDPDKAVTEFLEEHARHERETAPAADAAQITEDDREFLNRQQRAVQLLRAALMVVAVLAVAALVFELWVWWPRAEPAVATTPAPTPPPTPPPAAETAETKSATQAPPAANPAPPKPAPAPPPAEPPPSKPMTFEFVASGPCWLELSADGVVVFNRELQAGERQRVEATKELRVHAGDAGVLEWTIDGAAAALLGEAGKSARATVTPQTVKKYLKRSPSP
jgi:cytoskeletal protein RodZ